MRTYLYNRISSGKQNRGDGLTRQSESIEVLDFIKNHKLQVVQTMEYVGSSFSGKNFNNDTVLGKFIEDVKTGKIPIPICLCFENWDRFGRDIEWKNTKRFLDLIYAGVSIGVVSMDIVIDQKVLSENSNILQLVVNDIQRARKESERKSGFSKRNLIKKVARAKKGEKVYFGGQSPRWINGVKDGQFVKDDCMVEDIKRIYDLYLSGKSCIAIAKILNVEKKTRFGLSKKIVSEKKSKAYWYNTTIRNILTNKSLTGWCKINDFETNDYYPEIIDEQTFNRVQNRIDKNAYNRGGCSSGNVTNLFKCLMWCASCGHDVGVRYHKVGNTYYSYMGCRKSRVNLCTVTTWWKTDDFEEMVFRKVLLKSPDELLFKPTPKTDSQLGKLNTELGRLNIVIKRLSEMANNPDLEDVAELQSNLTKASQQRNLVRIQIQQEESKQAVIKTNPISVLKLMALFNKSKSSVTEIDSEGNRVTETVVLFANDPKKAVELLNQLISSDKELIRKSLKNNSVRAELKNIIPDLISRIDVDLAGYSFAVLMTSGVKKEMRFATTHNRKQKP